MKKVIVTGANGFLGSRLCAYLFRNGAEVYSLVQEGCDTAHVKGNIIPFNLNDPAEARAYLPADSDALYHFAWAGVSTTYKNDFDMQSANIAASLQCLRLAQDVGAKKIIFPGSVSEYAYVDGPVNENSAPSPADMYSACKVSVHMVCDVYSRQNRLPFIWALLPSIYGPGREDNNMITYAIKELLQGGKPSFTKLEQQWDYLYIDDAVKALALVGEKGREGRAYTLGSGEAMPLSAYVYAIRDAINPELSLGIGEIPYKTQQIDNSVVDISLLRKDTGFVPDYTFEEGIGKTIDYFRERQERGTGGLQ